MVVKGKGGEKMKSRGGTAQIINEGGEKMKIGDAVKIRECPIAELVGENAVS